MNILIQFILLYWWCIYIVLIVTKAVKHIRLSSAQQNSEYWKENCPVKFLTFKSLSGNTHKNTHFGVELQLPQENVYQDFASGVFQLALEREQPPQFPSHCGQGWKSKSSAGRSTRWRVSHRPWTTVKWWQPTQSPPGLPYPFACFWGCFSVFIKVIAMNIKYLQSWVKRQS